MDWVAYVLRNTVSMQQIFFFIFNPLAKKGIFSQQNALKVHRSHRLVMPATQFSAR
jgi:hypothetical protein